MNRVIIVISCVDCFQNQSTFQFQNNPAPILAAGSPGRYYSSGGVFFFDRLDNLTDLEPGDAKPVYVPASHGMSPFIRKPYLTVNSAEQQTYYGKILCNVIIDSLYVCIEKTYLFVY